MRYAQAVKKLRRLARACGRVGVWPPWEEPFLVEMYAFGAVVEGADPLEVVQVAGVINLPPAKVLWNSSPYGTQQLANDLRLGDGGYEYRWRSHLDPVWNHYIQGPVRIWSRAGAEEATLDALAKRRFDDLRRLVPDPAEQQRQLLAEVDAAQRRLRRVRDRYWDREWRREHKGPGQHPENELWEAVSGYLELLEATQHPWPHQPH